ncbi:MAG: WG repeat-containing protein [Ruminiclostridium sp.]
MKLFKKIMSCFLAGAAAVTMLCAGMVSAGAASYRKVVTSSTPKELGYGFIGQDLYYDAGGNLYRITEKNIKNWQETGKLKKTKIKLPSEMNGAVWSVYGNQNYIDSNVALFYKDDKQMLCRYDKSKNALTKVYSTPNYCGVSKNGVISEFSWADGNGGEPGKLTLNLISNTGEKIKTITFDCYSANWNAFSKGSKYAYVVCGYSKDGVNELGYNIEKAKLIRIDEKGNQKVLKKFRTTGFTLGVIKNCVLLSYSMMPQIEEFYYFSDTNKFSEAHSVWIGTTGFSVLGGSRIYGNTAILKSSKTDTAKYVLADIKDGKALSGAYKYMLTNDGKIYLVQNDKGQWGYINSKGKELGWFDDVTYFVDGYALVIKNGKAYFIDKNMKRVSETIKAESIYSGGKLFYYQSGDAWRVVTMK